MKKLFGKKEVNPNSDGIQKEINEMIVCRPHYLTFFLFIFSTHIEHYVLIVH